MVIFFISVFILLYIYVFFPLIIYIFGAVKKEYVNTTFTANDKSIVIVVPAHNEESVISKKIENHLALDYDKASYKILVISDTSTDQTVSITKSYIEKYPGRVELFEVSDGLAQ